MFRIKICGVTQPQDAQQAATAGADAVGVNFFRKSSRCVSVDQAAEILAPLPPEITRVGVFVNAPPDEICATFDRLGLSLIQLHGDEPPSLVAQLGSRPVVRAFRCREDGLAPVGKWLDECRSLGGQVEAVLLDAYQKGQYGGTGRTLDWSALAGASDTLGGIPVVLAGGLKAENVAEAIEQARPAAVDTASGVESAPGVKDAEQVRRFVLAAQKALIHQSS